MRGWLALLGLSLAVPAFGWDGEDGYGSGVHQDRYGRPFTFQGEDGAALPPGARVRPDVYGPGIAEDEYGRPVRAYEFGSGTPLDPFAVDRND